MSHGNVSALYRPIDSKIVEQTKILYGACATQIARQLTGCNIESLLFVSIVDQYVETKVGNGYDLQFSAIRRDNTGKAQTPQMKLLHDVSVELMMAGLQSKRLDKWLRKQGLAYCHRHSCGNEMVPVAEELAWYKRMGPDQLNRTGLDWSGTHEIVHCFGCLSKTCFVPINLGSIYKRIFENTSKILEKSGYPASFSESKGNKEKAA